MRSIAATLVISTGAAVLMRPTPVLPEDLFRQTLTQLRDGDFVHAAAQAHALVSLVGSLRPR